MLDPPNLLKWGDSARSVKTIGTLVTNNYLPDGSRKRVEFRDTLHVPELEINLMSAIHFPLSKIYCAFMLGLMVACLVINLFKAITVNYFH